MKPEQKRFRRGDTDPNRPGKRFWRYKFAYSPDKQEWRTEESFKRGQIRARAIHQKEAKDPRYKARAAEYMREYQKLPERKAYHLAYYRQPHVRDRYRARWNSDPRTIARREERKRKRKEQKAYLASPEYAEVLRNRHQRTYKQRVANGKNANYWRNKYRGNIEYRIGNLIRRRINKALRYGVGVKSAHTLDLIGCSFAKFRSHLESQFLVGMTWENMGQWHIDHRVPLASFNLADPEQQKLAFNYHNCRPLWKMANHQKSDWIVVDGQRVRAREVRGKIVSVKFV
jgi:hypothetical protein